MKIAKSPSIMLNISPEKVATAQQFTATELRHGVLINNGDAAFEFRPLPMLAQIAPAFGVVSGDFNLDGDLDIFLLQNSFAPQPETGRMDGGLSLLLLGDGSGALDVVWPDKSGLMISGDAKALTTADLNQDGRADFVLSRNDDTMLVFRNATGDSDEDGQPLVIRLAGRAGNPTGVGARITVIRSDASLQSAEVHAGSGYLSQSAPLAFFGSPAQNSIQRIQVSWPSGQISKLEWNQEKHLIISEIAE